ANHIVLFQAVCHTSLCTVPYLLEMLNSVETGLDSPWVIWVSYAAPYFPAMFVSSIALSSSFSFYKLWRRRRALRSVSSVVVMTSSSK
uniref:G protein-coupled receptor n=1 Tax=Steinernema glaseri TaxID=37863 RepID=A0A1I7Y5Z4_9BILA